MTNTTLFEDVSVENYNHLEGDTEHHDDTSHEIVETDDSPVKDVEIQSLKQSDDTTFGDDTANVKHAIIKHLFYIIFGTLNNFTLYLEL